MKRNVKNLSKSASGKIERLKDVSFGNFLNIVLLFIKAGKTQFIIHIITIALTEF